MAVNNPAAALSQDITVPMFVLKPEYWPAFVAKYGAEFMTPSGYEWLRATSSEYPVAATDYYWFEKTRYNEPIVVLAPVVSPGAGNPISFTLAPTSVDSNNLIHVRENDQLLFSNEVPASVINIDRTIPSAPVVTARPLRSTDTIPALAANDQIIITTNNHSDGSDQPEGIVPKVDRFSGTTHIIKDTFSADGTVLTDQTWASPSGAVGQSYVSILDKAFQYRMAVQIDGALMFSKSNNNSVTSTYNSKNVRSTTGLIPSIRERGNTIAITPGTFTISDLDTYDRILTREGASSMACYQMGLERAQEVNNTIFTAFKDTNMEAASAYMAMFGVDNEDTAKALATLMRVKTHTTTTRTWVFKQMETWSDPGMYAATGYKMPRSGFIYPMGKTQTVFKEEDSTYGEKVENFHMVYKQLDGYNRKMKIWKIGGAQGVLSSIDLDNTYGRMDIGFRGLGMNQLIYTPSTL